MMLTLTLQQRIHRQLDPEASPRYGLSPVHAAIAALLLVCTTIASLDLVRLARLRRFFQVLRIVSKTVFPRHDKLLAGLAATVALLVLVSALFYPTERETQPDNFGSIPWTMSWTISTLTTVGYGDVFP